MRSTRVRFPMAWCADAGAALRSAGCQHGEAFSARATSNAFGAARPFVSPHIGIAAHGACLSELLLALAVLGLPSDADPAHPPERLSVELLREQGRIRYTARGTPAVLFFRDLSPAPPTTTSTVIVGRTFIDPSDEWMVVKGRRVQRMLTAAPGDAAVEMLQGKRYRAQVVVTNVSSATRTASVLMCVPCGALPLSKGKTLQASSVSLGPFSSQVISVDFYFPRPGSFMHYGPHVATAGELLAWAPAVPVHVVQRATREDAESWDVIARAGSLDQVLAYVRTCDTARTDFSKLLWRCNVRPDWLAILHELEDRQVFHEAVWSCCVLHQHAVYMRQFLTLPHVWRAVSRVVTSGTAALLPLLAGAMEPGVAAMSGGVADMGASGNDAVYEHMEYAPLVNARAHQLGRTRKLVNEGVSRQYTALLTGLATQPRERWSPQHMLALTYHLLLQDRGSEAWRVFQRIQVPEGSIAARMGGSAVEMRPDMHHRAASESWQTLMFDYMAAYFDVLRGCETYDDATGAPALPVASAVAQAYRDYPIASWASRFRELACQLLEMGVTVGGMGAAAVRDAPQRNATPLAGEDAALQRASNLVQAADASATLSASASGGVVELTCTNLTAVQVRVFEMDLELLFSSAAFMLAGSVPASGTTEAEPAEAPTPASVSLGRFAYVRPNFTLQVGLPPTAAGRTGRQSIALPAAVRQRNALVELFDAKRGVRCVCTHFASDLTVSVAEPLGRLKVTRSSSGAPLPQVYVKVYYRTEESDTRGRFYKDGYTDVRGAFDYVSLSTDELSCTHSFAILVLSDANTAGGTSAGAEVCVVKPPAGSQRAA